MKALVLLVFGVALCIGVGGAFRRPVELPAIDHDRVSQATFPKAFRVEEGEPLVGLVNKGYDLAIDPGVDGAWMYLYSESDPIVAKADQRSTERLVSYSTGMSWLHPTISQPSAMVMRVAERFMDGSISRPEMVTALLVDHGDLPIVSLLVPEGALFDPDTGIYVAGNAALHPTMDMVSAQMASNRWWNYPGNFHFRGKEWERKGHIQFIAPTGKEVFSSSVGIRVNGQMTRGFPMHALRIMFDPAIDVSIFDGANGAGTKMLLLRTAGNDQMKAMLRDALAHELCRGMPFETSRSVTCAAYINGAYWGVHQLRERVEEDEIARRYSVSTKKIAFMEIRGKQVLGPTAEVEMFQAEIAELMDIDPSSAGFRAMVQEHFDLEGFMSYMAAVMILDNKDWPDANIKFWRYTGKSMDQAPLNGKWHFVLTDMDLAMGAYGAPEAPLLDRVKGRTSPIAKLFNACMRSKDLQGLFIQKVDAFTSGPLSSKVTISMLNDMSRKMEPEMARHIARWRKPMSVDQWQSEVERVRNYLRSRPGEIRAQIPGLFR